MVVPWRYEAAEFIAASWVMAGHCEKSVPCNLGTLDHALLKCIKLVPESLRDKFTFGTTSVGTRCYEMDEILWAAQETYLIELDGSTFTRAKVRLSIEQARGILIEQNVPYEVATTFGKALFDNIENECLSNLDM